MSHFTLANLDWVFMRVTAAENWDIGWTLDGNEFNISSTWAGRPARAAHSAERALTCSWDGTSPVTKSQKRDSFYQFNKISYVQSKKMRLWWNIEPDLEVVHRRGWQLGELLGILGWFFHGIWYLHLRQERKFPKPYPWYLSYHHKPYRQ